MLWSIITVYYTDEEVTNAGIDESTLRLYYYDENIVQFTKEKKDAFNHYSWRVENTEIYKEETQSPSLLIAGIPIVYSFYKDFANIQPKFKLKNLIF